MSSLANASRISISENRGITGALFGLAIITYVTRAYIRARILKQFLAEDALLLLAVVCLCGTTALTYKSMQNQYDALAAILHNAGSDALVGLINEIPTTSKLENAAATLWWGVIFPVKLAFLFFFRRLIARWHSLSIWWGCAMALTVAAFAVSIAADWLTCPYFDVIKILSCSGPSANYRVIRDTAITTAMDILTDLIVLSFPVIILWRVRVNTRQKAGIGLWLCLSVVMVVIAIVRMSGIMLATGDVDIVWVAFWQQQESSIAVMMVSMSSFRSFFVDDVGTPSPRRHLSYFANKRKKRPVWRALGTDDEFDDSEQTMGLPRVPRAMLTGMSQIIREA